MKDYGVLNMLNVKYIVFGPDANNIIPNPSTNGNGWFVKQVVPATSANEAISKTCSIDTRHEAVIEGAAPPAPGYDSASTIQLTGHGPREMRYETHSNADGLAVFSEIYYPVGWKATIDGKESPILRANYVLRALNIPAGEHKVVFRFDPPAYVTGNTITTIFSWLVILVLIGSVALALREPRESSQPGV
jgi:hypothetical protein